MRTLYLECRMGAAGDMLAAALFELLSVPERETFLKELNGAGIPGVRVAFAPAEKCGVLGTRAVVQVNGAEEGEGAEREGGPEEKCCGPRPDGRGRAETGGHGAAGVRETAGASGGPHARAPGAEASHGHDGGHHHEIAPGADAAHSHAHSRAGLSEIRGLVGSLSVPEKIRGDILAVYRMIADAESDAHGVPVERVHFHEVGAADAVADICAVSMLVARLAPDRILASPVALGSGSVVCAHGVLPVPAPATARLVRGIPVFGGGEDGELCTPTGAALLRYFVGGFGEMPCVRIEKTGCGMGKRDFKSANCVRAFLCQSEEEAQTVLELKCTLDDMTGEALGFAVGRLLDGGALDVYTEAVGMKKGRPGTLLTCLCAEKDRDRMVGLIFRNTTTLGVRECRCRRYALSRAERTEETPYGKLRVKTASGWGVVRSKPEYDDVARLAGQSGESFLTVSDSVKG